MRANMANLAQSVDKNDVIGSPTIDANGKVTAGGKVLLSTRVASIRETASGVRLDQEQGLAFLAVRSGGKIHHR